MGASDNFRLLVGLGNPGAKYERTRHNIGFMFLDRMLASVGRWRSRGQGQLAALTSEFEIAGSRKWALKPQCFMNLSGGPVADMVNFYKILPAQVIVVHDEIDLPLGTIRIKCGGGDGGHNGLKSISQSLGSADFTRIRLGVGRPEELGAGARQNSGEQFRGPSVSDWVLGSFTKEEEAVVDEMLGRATCAVEVLNREGLKVVQNRFNN